MAQMMPVAEMTYFLDPDLPSIQLLSEHTKHCRLCCMTHVCDDIWKKFEVFPTPPVSPSPEPDSDCEEYDQEMAMYEYDVDKQMLEWEEACQSMKANLIQGDCMWGAGSQPVTTAASAYSTPIPSPTSFSDSELSFSEIVDPSMVIPLVSRSSYLRHSCSSQDDSDEEIDVVTVEHNKNKFTEKRISHSAPETPVSSPVKKPKRMPTHTSSSHSSNRYHRRLSYHHQRRRVNRIEVERRASHNVLERKRRNDLKSSFNTLREHVPDLENNEKAPKVMILQKAACYIKEIRDMDTKLTEEIIEEQRKQELLLHKLHKLKEFYNSN